MIAHRHRHAASINLHAILQSISTNRYEMLPSTGVDCHGLPMQTHHLFIADSSHLELYSASSIWRTHDWSVEPSFVDYMIMRRYSYDAMKDVPTGRSDVGLRFPSSFNIL